MSLTEHWETGTPSIQAHGFLPSCSFNLKINPQEKFVDKYLSEKYQLEYNGRKKSFLEYAKIHGKVSWLVGISQEEESRTFGGNFYAQTKYKKLNGIFRKVKKIEKFLIEANGVKQYFDVDTISKDEKYINFNNERVQIKFEYNPVYKKNSWKSKSVQTIYPLIDYKFNRKDCQDYIIRHGYKLPQPSSCRFCPSGSTGVELLFLYRTDKEGFYEWVDYEKKKLKAYTGQSREVTSYYYLATNDKKVAIKKKDLDEVKRSKMVLSSTTIEPILNLGVASKLHDRGDKKGQPVTLIDSLEEAKRKFGHMTLDEIYDYKQSHGHCVRSKH